MATCFLIGRIEGLNGLSDACSKDSTWRTFLTSTNPAFSQDFIHSTAAIISTPRRFLLSEVSIFALRNNLSTSADMAGIERITNTI